MRRTCLFTVTVLMALGLIATSGAVVAHSLAGAPDGSSLAGGERSAIDSYVTGWFETGRFNGSVLVAKNGEVIFKKGYGLADVENNVTNEPDTKFRILSISKQFTTVVVFQLAAEGKLSPGDRITKYLPDYRRDTGDRVTVDHLLRHTAGIPCYINDPGRLRDGLTPYRWEGVYDRKQFVKDYMSGDLMFEPGSDYKYSNTGYYLLARIIEAVSGKSYEQNLRERIFVPVRMKDSGVLERDTNPSGFALGYSKGPEGLVEVPWENPDNLVGAGNIYSTVEDLLKWDLALESGTLLPDGWREKMFGIYWEHPQQKYAYSINYYKRPDPAGGEMIYTGFSGGGPGYNSDVFRFPDDGLIVAILDNSSQYNHWRIAPDICLITRGHKVPPPKGLMADILVRAVADGGLDAAMAEYEGIRKNRMGDFERGSAERDLNGYGYSALRDGRTDLAIEIFRLNTELYPDSWNVFDSLAEAYKAAGEEELSEKNYAIAREKRDREMIIIGHMRKGEFDEAMRVVEKAHAEDPGLVLLTGPRVGPFFDQVLGTGNNEKALEICRVWASADPSGPGAYFSMARVYLAMADPDKAKECYRRIIEDFPDSRGAGFARRRLAELGKE